jgi:hypothetical protein
MRIKATLPLVLLLSAFAVAVLAADDKKEDRKETGKNPGLEKFKQLAGEWEGKETEGLHEGQKLNVKYKVTAGGSAVVETLFPGTEQEMVTVIHPDGDELVLTHYCMLGNQPHMKAEGKGDGDKIAFKFTGASNLKSDKDMHMHDATYTFVDKDTLKTEWTHYMDGKAGGKVVFELKRKK